MEHLKKPYRPKDENVKKLKKVYQKIKKQNPDEGFTFKKVTGILLLVVLLSSCSANWHLRRAISKDPSILVPSETTAVIDTVIITKRVTRTDTFTMSDIDTIQVVTDSISYQIIRRDSLIYVRAECPPDTIQVSDTVRIKLPPRIEYRERERTIGKILRARGYWGLIPWLLILAMVAILFLRRR